MSFLAQDKLEAAKATPQNQRADPTQVENYGGGFSFEIDPWQQLDRFLILGTQGGTYYVDQTDLTEKNAAIVKSLLAANPEKVVGRIVQISDEGRAIKQDYGLFALALAACSDAKTRDGLAARVAAYEAIPRVCRTGSTLMQFLSYIRGRRGWSRGLRNAIAKWCTFDHSVDRTAYQFTKYRNRSGFTPRDVLRLSHAKPDTATQNAIFKWAVGKGIEAEYAPRLLRAIEAIPTVAKEDRRHFVEEHRLVREHLPTEWLDDLDVQRALLAGIPVGALVRNLGTYTASGLFTGKSDETKKAVELLTNPEAVLKSRIHPIAIFLASKIYGSGRGLKGRKSWDPVNAILDALNKSFDLAFTNVAPIGGRVLVAIDCSGSMQHGSLAGLPLTAAEASAAMATVFARSEPEATFYGFTCGSSGGYYGGGSMLYSHGGGGSWLGNGLGIERLKWASDITIERALRNTDAIRVGEGTDCSLPVRYALSQGLNVDTFILFTDSETWAGSQHPHESLVQYRAKCNKNARLVVCSTAATSHSIGDPRDAGTLQCAGFDAALPQVVASFGRGEF